MEKYYGLNVRTTSGPDLAMAKRKNEKIPTLAFGN